MKPWIPVYKRSPNKFLRYEKRAFTDRSGNSGIVKVAIFLDKNGEEQEMVAFVIWDQENMLYA